MKQYILAIDQGTTSSRAIIFDHEARIVSSSQIEVAIITRKDGWVEQNAEEIWKSVKYVINNALNKAKLTMAHLKAIGITNQRETTIVWDKLTGKPVSHAIVWQSRQSNAICNRLKRQGLEPLVTEKTGLLIDPYFSASKLIWLFENIPGLKTRAEQGEVLFGTVDSYIIYRLTNGKVHATDPSNASRTMFYNIHEHAWDDELLQLFEIPKQMLPEVLESGAYFGDATDLGSNVPIHAVLGDQQASLFGQCAFTKGTLKNTYGTGCFMLLNVGAEPVNVPGLLTTIAWTINGNTTYALEGSVFVAGSVVQWLRDKMTFFKTAAESEEAARGQSDSHGVFFVPAFVGLGAPYWNDQVRGAIFGLTRATTKADITLAALNAICYQVYDVAALMKQHTGIDVTTLYVDGGASANNYILQFQANLLDTPIIRPECLETTALGVAFLAGLQVGFWKSLAELERLHRVEKLFMNQMDPETREALLDKWHIAVEACLTFTPKEQ